MNSDPSDVRIAAELARARELLALAARVLVLTGAGISAESGVPTFRGNGGLWKTFRAEDLATPGAFARDPRLVWEWYGWRRSLVAACAPNAAHEALARFALGRPDVSIVTQNVDGLHSRAAERVASDQGIDDAAARAAELHGSLWRIRCTGCEHRWDDAGPIDATSRDTLPRCQRCGSLARPDIAWFGEALEDRLLDYAFHSAEAADVCLVVGTSALVHPAAGIPGITARTGGHIIEVNPAPTALTGESHVSLRGTAVSIIPCLVGAAPAVFSRMP